MCTGNVLATPIDGARFRLTDWWIFTNENYLFVWGDYIVMIVHLYGFRKANNLSK